jgi:hypothetical protein
MQVRAIGYRIRGSTGMTKNASSLCKLPVLLVPWIAPSPGCREDRPPPRPQHLPVRSTQTGTAGTLPPPSDFTLAIDRTHCYPFLIPIPSRVLQGWMGYNSLLRGGSARIMCPEKPVTALPSHGRFTCLGINVSPSYEWLSGDGSPFMWGSTSSILRSARDQVRNLRRATHNRMSSTTRNANTNSRRGVAAPLELFEALGWPVSVLKHQYLRPLPRDDGCLPGAQGRGRGPRPYQLGAPRSDG